MDELEEGKIEKIINVYKGVYAGLLGVCAFALFWMLLRGFKTDHLPYVTLNTVIFATIYYGLKRRKQWLVNLIMVCSAFLSFNLFMNVVAGKVGQGSSLTGKLLSVIMFAFFGYQIIYFAKSSVRKFFRSKGNSIF